MAHNRSGSTPARRFFWQLTRRPWMVLALAVVAVASSLIYLPRLTRDTSAEAFIRKDHPSVRYRDQVREVFGLSDPIVVAIVQQGEMGVFQPRTLALVAWLTEALRKVPGIDPDQVMSLATENDVVGTMDGLRVEPFFEAPPASEQEAQAVRAAVLDFPLYVGSLVAEDGSATIVVAELLDEDDDAAVYREVLAVVERAPVEGERLYVAGEGAARSFLGTYIDRDAARLNPVAAVIICGVLFIAFRTLRGVVIPNLVVLAAVGAALGSMAASGVPFYVITNSLPVLLIGTSVADSIHILSQYYEEHARDPSLDRRELTVRAMTEMWRPILVTSLTDVGGLLGLSFASYMPPMRAFGLFASIGVLAALLVSLTAVPALLCLLPVRGSRAFALFAPENRPVPGDRFSRLSARLGGWVARRPGTVVAIAAVVALLGVAGVLRLEVNEERISNFRRSEPIYQADKVINRHLDGTNYLDVVLDSGEIEGLFDPQRLRRIEALQEFLEAQPHVRGTTSVVDYLKQMNRAMNEDRPEAYELPASAPMVAQYFLLYSASGDPSDFEEEVDYDYRRANVRATLDTGLFSDISPVVQSAERYLQENFGDGSLSANLAGRVNVDYHWIDQLASSHFRSLLVALAAVWIVISLSFRSPVAGLLAVTPVVAAILLIYSVMGWMGIWLAVGTSMFAAIAIGTAVDFAVHTVDRLMVLLRDEGRGINEAFAMLYPSTGRALLFNFTAVLLGFGVLMTSQVPPLVRFGGLVAVAVSVSFLASVTLLPALVKIMRPRFLGFDRDRETTEIGVATTAAALDRGD